MPATTATKVKEKNSASPISAPVEDNRQKIRIKIRAYDYKIIDQAAKTIIDGAQRSGAQVFGPIPLPTAKKKYTVNRSTFVHKTSREQFEMRVHKRLIDVIEPTAKTVELLSSLSLPAGVDVEIKM
jgi:small subunit ribosomal protein S10